MVGEVGRGGGGGREKYTNHIPDFCGRIHVVANPGGEKIFKKKKKKKKRKKKRKIISFFQ